MTLINKDLVIVTILPWYKNSTCFEFKLCTHKLHYESMDRLMYVYFVHIIFFHLQFKFLHLKWYAWRKKKYLLTLYQYHIWYHLKLHLWWLAIFSLCLYISLLKKDRAIYGYKKIFKELCMIWVKYGPYKPWF